MDAAERLDHAGAFFLRLFRERRTDASRVVAFARSAVGLAASPESVDALALRTGARVPFAARIFRRRVATPPRLGRGYSAETTAGTWIFRGDDGWWIFRGDDGWTWIFRGRRRPGRG